MTTFPDEIDEFRPAVNLPGITYNPTDFKTLFAEDYNAHSSAIIALENFAKNNQGFKVYDSFSDLPGDVPDLSVALCRYDEIREQAPADFDTIQTYENIFTRPFIDVSDIPLTDPFSATFESGSQIYQISFYPAGDDTVPIRYLQIINQFAWSDYYQQNQYLFFYEPVDIVVSGRIYHVPAGWNYMTVKLTDDGEGGIKILEIYVFYNDVPDFNNVKFNTNDESSLILQNYTFTTTASEQHRAGLYQKIDGVWTLICRSGDFKPLLLPEVIE